MSDTIQQPVMDAADEHAQFRRPAYEALTRVRDAMKGFIQAAPEPVSRAVDLQNALGIYSTLAWQTFKIATVADPLDVAEYILTPAMVNTLLEAAAKKGVHREAIDEVRAAMDMYATLLHEHAGDTDALAMMLASLQPKKEKNRTLLDEKLRKSLFQHNRLVWGNETDVAVACFIVEPSPTAPTPPTATNHRTAGISGRAGYRQIRPAGKEFTIISKVSKNDNPFLDESVTDVNHGFLMDFCSPHLKMDVVQKDEQYVKSRILLPELGRKSALNYFQLMTSDAQVLRPQQSVTLNMLVSAVSAMAHLDILVPAWSEPRRAYANVYGQNGNAETAAKRSPDDLMPIELAPAYLGPMLDAPPAKGVPRYAEMIRSVLQRFGWHGQRFDVYRCRMPYPILNSVVSLTVESTAPDADSPHA